MIIIIVIVIVVAAVAGGRPHAHHGDWPGDRNHSCFSLCPLVSFFCVFLNILLFVYDLYLYLLFDISLFCLATGAIISRLS